MYKRQFYRWLKQQKPGLLGLENVKWNFTKFLINRDGEVVERFAPQTKPDILLDEICALPRASPRDCRHACPLYTSDAPGDQHTADSYT
ncbi:hypothetical protein ACQ4LF_23985, partial [Aeromonas salmonicida]